MRGSFDYQQQNRTQREKDQKRKTKLGADAEDSVQKCCQAFGGSKQTTGKQVN